MINLVFNNTSNNTKWIDVINPTPEDYKSLEIDYKLHPVLLEDCMQPSHLPKVEKIDDWFFLITRIYDVDCTNDAETVQEMTNKVAIFFNEEYFITIHRSEEPFLNTLLNKWKDPSKIRDPSIDHLFNMVISGIIYTYKNPLDEAMLSIDSFELAIFSNSKDSSILRKLYNLKRRGSVFKRMLTLTKEVIMRYHKSSHDTPFIRDLEENIDGLFFKADELNENVNNLLNLHLSLSSHRTNEVMGVLTIFSVFFLPLTFIVGLYGMNFETMPEIKYEHGYMFAWILMIITTLGTYIGFKKKGWL